jgi:8-oxo-dGTP diphosphatase
VTEGDRQFPARPIVGVGAVVVDGQHVLLVKRGRDPLKGEWSLPGGAVEVGETLAAAVQREVFEETGLVVAVGPIVEVLDRIHADGDGRVEYHYVLIDYLCSVVGGRLRAESDADDARWATRGELPAFRLGAATLAVIAKGLDLAAGPA